jgi:hypothetical protein
MVRCTWPAGPRYVLSYRQVSLPSAIERFNDANPIQILSVLSVMSLSVSTLKQYLYQWVDVLLGIHDAIGSLCMGVDLALHGGEGCPSLRTTRRPESRLPPRDRTDMDKHL